MSDVEKSLDSPTLQEQNEYHHKSDTDVGEAIGTIIVDENETGRETLRPQPSLDPNDPLVSIRNQVASLQIKANKVSIELASKTEICYLLHHLRVHLPRYRECVQIHRCSWTNIQRIQGFYHRGRISSLLQCSTSWLRKPILGSPYASHWQATCLFTITPTTSYGEYLVL